MGWRPAPTPRWIVGGAIAALVAAALFGDKGVLQLWGLRAEVESLHREVQVLEAENERLSRAITELHDNPAVIERIAREELGLVRPGERVLRFPRSPRPFASPDPPSDPGSAPFTFPRSP